jgi:ribosomal protein S10
MNFSNKFQLQISCPNNSTLKKLYLFFIYILEKNKILNLKIHRGYLPSRIKKFTVLKSPHVFKTARTQIETQTLKTIVTITNFSTFNEINQLQKICRNVVKNLPTTIQIKIKTFKLLYV